MGPSTCLFSSHIREFSFRLVFDLLTRGINLYLYINVLIFLWKSRTVSFRNFVDVKKYRCAFYSQHNDLFYKKNLYSHNLYEPNKRKEMEKQPPTKHPFPKKNTMNLLCTIAASNRWSPRRLHRSIHDTYEHSHRHTILFILNKCFHLTYPNLL